MRKDFLHWLRPRPVLGRVAINMRPVRGPWGGSSTFVQQLTAYLEWRGYETSFALEGEVDVVVVIDPRDDLQSKAFGMDDIARYRARNPDVKVIHRINECDQRKNTQFMDRLLEQANQIADYTVFISEWLLDYHAARWFDRKRAHAVVYNGADPRVFHPVGSAPWSERMGMPLRVVTHHWSDNPLKGFDVYAELDEAIASGALEDTELRVIGRWPSNIKWRSAVTVEPLHGARLAQELRKCHVYATASRWEPCGMHHVEGAQCGLPLVYHEEGGGIVEAGQQYGIAFGNGGVVGALERVRERYRELRAQVLERMPCGDRMVMDYARIIQLLQANTRQTDSAGEVIRS
jgi:glycosyltransferase involved in cell wall biosynthesis